MVTVDTRTLCQRLIELEPVAAADPAAIRVVRAPGRVNLIGEHTDYNEGFVLPVAIDLAISIALVPSGDGRVELTLAETGERNAFDLDGPLVRTGTWIDYVTGVAWALRESGIPMAGSRGLLASDLPQGTGLSSSAALQVAAAWTLCGGAPPPVDPMRLVHLVQRSENGYIGLNNGIMDQFASIFGTAGRALLLDCRSLDHRSVPLPLDVVALVVCDSASPRRLEASAYNERRAQCAAAVEAIAAVEPSVRSLRDVTPELLKQVRDRLDDITLARAEHVVTENARVLEAEDALGRGDLEAVGRLFAASHDSLRDRYQVSSPELDALVEIARETPGVVGARLTGAGFGGCTINLVRKGAVAGFRDRVLRVYPTSTGLIPRVIEVIAADGAGRIA